MPSCDQPFRSCVPSDVTRTSRRLEIITSIICHRAEAEGRLQSNHTRSSAIAEGPRDGSCQLKSCQLPRNSAETTYTTSPDQIDGMKLEI